jgi:hypothetical protein
MLFQKRAVRTQFGIYVFLLKYVQCQKIGKQTNVKSL